MFIRLKRYKDAHGDCNVSEESENNSQLGVWASAQRARKRKAMLSEAQAARLDALGFEQG
jgi:hypothetical protein